MMVFDVRILGMIQALTIFSAGLIISPESGEVCLSNSKDSIIRMTPVNIRVLKVLLDHPEQVVTRQKLFDSVWPNQVISDDALTRCISDLRQQLKAFDPQQIYIQTMPKKGYRWMHPIESTNDTATLNNKETKSHTKPSLIKTLAKLIVGLVLMMFLVLAVVNYWVDQKTTPMVVLPTIEQINSPLATSFKDGMNAAVLQHPALHHLSDRAIKPWVEKPYPYFSHQYGVRWVVESEIRENKAGLELVIHLVDARTAMVLYTEHHGLDAKLNLIKLSEQFLAQAPLSF